MWFVGLVIGVLIGAPMYGFGGAVLGAFIGAMAGWALGQARAPDDHRIETLERMLRQLQARLDTLERRVSRLAGAPEGVTPAPSSNEAEAAVEPAPPTPQPAPVPPTSPEAPAATPEPPPLPVAEPEDAAILARLSESAAPAPKPAPPPSPAMPAARPAPARKSDAADEIEPEDDGKVIQLIGVAIGAALGSLGGIAGAVIGALIGWGGALAVIAQNRSAARARSRSDVRKPVIPAAPAASPVQSAPSLREPEPPEPAPPWQPAMTESEGPSPLQTLWLRLISGNIVAKCGVLILFFGVGFLLKYAYEHTRIPIEVRLAGVALVGFAMIYVGWRLLDRRRLYGLILQGGGIGLLYLDVFFGLKVYNLIGATTGFACFMALGVAATLLAVRQDAKVLAVLGLTGAFLAPVLAGSKTGNHVLLFSYYTLLNAFILAISWFKAWRDLNLVGFVFTFIVGAVWGANNYRPELFGTVEPFVLVFFAMYLVIPILFAQRQPPDLKGLVDGTLVFGTPLCVAFMQSNLVSDMPYGLAWSAGIAAALYGVLAAMTITRDGMRLLGETYIALGVVFLTLAIFFAFDAYPTFALWTLEGAAIIWVGLRQGRLLARLFGYALQLAGAFYFLSQYQTYSLANPFWNAFVLGCAVISIAGFTIAWLLRRYHDRLTDGDMRASMLLVWGFAWWSIGGVHALHQAFGWSDFMMALLAFTAFTMAAVELAGARLQWIDLRRFAYVHLPVLVAIATMIAFGGEGRLQFTRPLAEGGWWAWPLNFLVAFWIQARQARDGLHTDANLVYTATWLLVAAIGTWDVLWLLDHERYGEAMAWGAAALVAACARFRLRERDKPEAAAIAVPVLVWAVAVWFVAGFGWMHHNLAVSARPMALLAYTAGSCLAFELLGGFVQWTALRRAASLLAAGMVLAFLAQLAQDPHPFGHYGWLTWPTALALLYLVLRRHENDAIAVLPPVQHLTAFWLGIAVLTWEAAWQVDHSGFGRPWLIAVCGIVPALAMGAITRFEGKSTWPFGAHYADIYRDWAAGPIAAYLLVWTLYANLYAPGDMRPLPYVPLINPLDIALAVAFAAAWRWSRGLDHEQDGAPGVRLPLFAALAFLWVNCILLRTIHYWGGVEYEWDALSHSVLVQSGFSLLWTATAFVLMLHATRKARRQLWMVGAGLLGVVVVKLFLNDLSNTGTIARIVSFIGVGAGLLLIGYVAPVPPGETERQAD